MTFNSDTLFEPEFLTTCSLFRLTDTEPFFLEQLEEGTIAYYGLILQSEFNQKIKDYLLLCTKDYLWEYQAGFGVTAADSALVIEGLLESGVSISFLERCLERLVELFYDKNEGAFKTVLDGRAAYWRGISTETTAHCAYLLDKISPTRYREHIKRCARYLRNTQQENGSWTGKWFPSVMIPTLYASRFLRRCGSEYDPETQQSVRFISTSQMNNGSWMNSIIETSAALWALSGIDHAEATLEKGRQWLLAQKGPGGWPGEPVLYYWFEEGPDKTFHFCRDKGRITTAWAKLGLEAARNKRDEASP